jgi:hypothetical protein
MAKLLTIICSTLFLLGAADLLTTVIGVTGKGAVEVNPLFAAITQTNIFAFIGIKIATVLFTGFMFLEAGRISKETGSNFIGKYFMLSASSISCLVMTTVVANNLLVLLKIP